MQDLDILKIENLACTACDLHKTRQNLVFGKGNPTADILFIGEAPGEKEDLSGEPFVGRSGKLLDTLLSSIDLTLADVYIANMIKCRPPNNRDPKQSEQIACGYWLNTQIEIIKPKIVVCLGRIAAQKFIRKHYKISTEHGNFETINDRLVTAIYHPAAILRNPKLKEDTLADLVKIQEEIMKL